MDSNIEKFAELYKPEEEDTLIQLSRFVRSTQGAVRYKTSIGSLISGKKGGSTFNKALPVGAPVSGGKAKKTVDDSADFKKQVVQLRKAVAKLDEKTIRNMLKGLKDSKTLPRNKKYNVITQMLEEFLKTKLEQVNSAPWNLIKKGVRTVTPASPRSARLIAPGSKSVSKSVSRAVTKGKK